jgi:anaerobic glycerol-3-phosphate dehydrogenase
VEHVPELEPVWRDLLELAEEVVRGLESGRQAPRVLVEHLRVLQLLLRIDTTRRVETTSVVFLACHPMKGLGMRVRPQLDRELCRAHRLCQPGREMSMSTMEKQRVREADKSVA